MSEILLAIVGSRNYTNYSSFAQIVETWVKENGQPSQIISGGARGVDSMAKKYAIEKKIQFVEYEAEWKKYGKQAGPIRNRKIVENCTHILALPSKKGKGTQITISFAEKKGRYIKVIYID